MKQQRRVVIIAAVVTACGCMLSPVRSPGQPPVPVTRGDLALELIKFEQSLASHPVEPDRVNAVNRAFDRASMAFFSGSYAEVIRQLVDLRLRLAASDPSPMDLLAGSLKARIEPPVWVIGSTAATARITHMFEAKAPTASHPSVFRIRSATGGVKFERPFAIEAGPATRVDQAIPLDGDGLKWEAGTYTLEAGPRAGDAVAIGRWIVVAKPLKEVRAENIARLDSIKPDDSAGLKDAIENCRGRNGLLRDRPSEDTLAEYLADLPEIAKCVDHEITAIKEGRNPYRRQAGDRWRKMKLMGVGVACRVFAPAAATGDTGVPLVIALHGAGGDENMFMDAYGRGSIKTLAEKGGFLVASPLTYPFTFNPALADELVNVLARDYAIDRTRVYVIGHSLGAMAASRVARERRGLVAAACCIAGGDFGNARDCVPALVFGGGVDPIVPAGSLKRGAQQAAKAGLPVEYRQMDDYGHTLMVERVLPDAVQWLVKHRLDPDASSKRRAARRAATSQAGETTTAPANR